MHSVFRNLLASLLFALAFVVNPAYFSGCASEEDEPKFGEAEMLELLDAANDMGPWQIESDGVDYEVELVLVETEGQDTVSQRSLLSGSQAFACGSRSFMSSASACDTYTELVVEGTLTLRRLDGEGEELISDAAVEGTMHVGSSYLTDATLQVELRDLDGWFTLQSDDGRTFSADSFSATGLGEDDGLSVQYEAQ